METQSLELRRAASASHDLLIAPIISIFKHEISEFTLAAQNVKDEDLFLGVAAEYSARATDHLAIAVNAKFRWSLAGCWLPL